MTKRFALLTSTGLVDNISEMDAPPSWGAWQECTVDVSVGDRWDGAAWVVQPPSSVKRLITPRALRARFTTAERVAIELAKLDDPSAPMAQRQQAAALRAYMDDVTAAQYIDLDDPSTVAGVQSLEAAGLIAPGRAADILGQDPQPGEQP